MKKGYLFAIALSIFCLAGSRGQSSNREPQISFEAAKLASSPNFAKDLEEIEAFCDRWIPDETGGEMRQKKRA